MKKILTGAMLAAAFTLSSQTFAMTLFADFDGDRTHDPRYEMGLTVNDNVTFDVYAQLTYGEDAAGGLLSFAIEGIFNPFSIVKVTGVSFDPPIIPGPIYWDDNSFRASGGFHEVLTPTSLVRLVTVDLTAISIGMTTLSLEEWDRSAAFDGNLLADGTVLDGTINSMASDINVIPIPAAIWLFGSGLFGLAWARERRKV